MTTLKVGMNVKSLKVKGAILALASTCVITGTVALPTTFAATTKSIPLPKGQVQAEVAGKPIQAIAVGDETYINWGALSRLHSPYAYMGNGQFAVSWGTGTIQGVIYHGATYIPWSQAAPNVKATPLAGGGFNFTAAPVKHDYQLVVATQDAEVGMPAPIEVMLTDGNNSVPGQKITIATTGSSTIENTGGVQRLSTSAGTDGTWLGAISDTKGEIVDLTIKWIDPAGNSHTHVEQVAFVGTDGVGGASGTPNTGVSGTTGTNATSGASNATTSTSGNSTTSSDASSGAASSAAKATANASGRGAGISSGGQVVTTVPMATFANEALFNAKSNGDTILFQLDTGAFEPLLTKQTAELLHLPNLGSIQVAGIGGADNAYLSKMTLSIGGVQFKNVPCIVDETYTGNNLFGYGFFSDNMYDLTASQTTDTLTISE